MTQERDESPRPRYRVVSPSFSELVQKSEHLDRVFPETVIWRREQHRRAEMEATNDEELLHMRSQIAANEWQVFPEVGMRIMQDVGDDMLDERESELRLRYLYLFGLMNPLELLHPGWRTNWVKAFDISF